jgi:hypothetical protein
MAIVMCRVSGEVTVTGTRQAPLKDENGNVRHFDTLQLAKLEAERIQQNVNGMLALKATFEYYAVA